MCETFGFYCKRWNSIGSNDAHLSSLALLFLFCGSLLVETRLPHTCFYFYFLSFVPSFLSLNARFTRMLYSVCPSTMSQNNAAFQIKSSAKKILFFYVLLAFAACRRFPAFSMAAMLRHAGFPTEGELFTCCFCFSIRISQRIEHFDQPSVTDSIVSSRFPRETGLRRN